MTANQIAYNKLLEDQRHNFVTESEANRHNLAGEAETSRHNRATEDWQNRSLLETVRHNYAQESLTAQQIATSYEVGMANAAATRYAADVNASTQRYVANVNASTQRYTASLNATTSLLNTRATNASRERQSNAANKTNLQIQQLKSADSTKSRNTSTLNSIISSTGSIIGAGLKIATTVGL